MKIIFLDIDGVLNHELWFESIRKKKKYDKDDYSRYFAKDSVANLNEITDKTRAKIVVSSSWRTGRTTEELAIILKDNGVTGEIIGKTPNLYFSNKDYDYSVPRGCEIKAWMEMNKGILGDKMSKVKYVILDDDSDMLYWQRNEYFRIDGYCGITPNDAYRIIRFLER